MGRNVSIRYLLNIYFQLSDTTILFLMARIYYFACLFIGNYAYGKDKASWKVLVKSPTQDIPRKALHDLGLNRSLVSIEIGYTHITLV